MSIQCKASPLELRSSRAAKPNYLAGCLAIFMCIFLFFFAVGVLADFNRVMERLDTASSTESIPTESIITATPDLQQVSKCKIHAKARLTLLSEPDAENGVGYDLMLTGELRAILYIWGDWLAVETETQRGHLWVKDNATKLARLGECSGTVIANYITN